MSDVEIRFTGDSSDAQSAAASIDAALEQIERLANQVSRALGDIKIGAGQVASFVAEVRTMEAALSSLERQADRTKRGVRDIGPGGPGTLLAAAVTGRAFTGDRRIFEAPSVGGQMVPYSAANLLTQNRVFGVPGQYAAGFMSETPFGPEGRRSGGSFGSISDPWSSHTNIRYGTSPGGYFTGGDSDRTRGGLVGSLFGARGGGGGDRIGRILGGLSPDDDGGGRGYRGRYAGPDFLHGLLPGGARATPAALGSLALAGIGIAPELGAPLIAGIGAIPAMVTTGVAALGTLKLAFTGVGAAIGGNAKEFNDLNAQAQKFALTVRGLDPFLTKLQSTAAGSMFPGLTSGLASFLNPRTQSNLNQTVGLYGRTIGGIGQQAGQFLGGADMQKMLMQLSTAGAGGLKQLSQIVINLADAFTRVGVAALPLTKWMGDLDVKASQWIDKFIQGKQATGELGAFFTGLEGPISMVGHLIGSIIKVLGDLVSILNGAGKVALSGLIQLLDGLHAWLNKNHDALANLATFISQVVVGAIKDLASVIGPGVTGLVSLADALTGMVSALGGIPAAMAAVTAAMLTFAKNPEIVALIAAMTALGYLYNKVAGSKDNFNGQFPTGPENPSVIPTTGPRKAHAQEVISLRAKGWSDQKIQSYLMGEQKPMKGFPQFGKGASGDLAMTSAFTDAQAIQNAPKNPKTGKYSYDQLKNLWIMAGGDPAMADTMAAVALAESSGQPRITSKPNTNGTVDRGLWQINSSHGYGTASLDPYRNAQEAVSIYGSQGLHAWTTYNTGAYLGYMGGGSKRTTPAWKPGSVPVDTGKGALPMAMQIALQGASNRYQVALGTPGLKDDTSAGKAYQAQIRKAEAYLNGLKAKLDGQDLLDATTELGSLISTYNSVGATLKANAKKGRASLGSRLSGQRAGAGVLSLIKTALGPISGLGSGLVTDPTDILNSSPLHDAHSQLDSSLGSWEKQIKALDKQLGDKMISTDTVAKITDRIHTIKTNVTKALDEIKAAAKQQAADFKSVWDVYVGSVNEAFEKQTNDVLAHPEKYPGILPVSAALADLEDTHTQQELKQRIEDAQKQLADALSGVGNDSDVLARARDAIGKDALAHALDVAQSAILGGKPMDMTEKIIKDMQEALAAAGVPDPQAVKDAQKAVDDAVYEQKVFGLQKQASAEQDAYRDSRTELEKHLDETLKLWEGYYAKQGMKASEALAALNALLVKFGFAPITDPYNPGTGPYAGPPGTETGGGPSPGYGNIPLPGKPIPMADGGIVTSPHFLVDAAGRVRGMIGEAGPEMVVPMSARTGMVGVSGGGLSTQTSQQPIEVHLHTKDDALADFIDVRVVHPSNVNAISRIQGREGNVRYRSGRF